MRENGEKKGRSKPGAWPLPAVPALGSLLELGLLFPQIKLNPKGGSRTLRGEPDSWSSMKMNEGKITPYTEFNRRMELKGWKTRISDRLPWEGEPGLARKGCGGREENVVSSPMTSSTKAPSDYIEGLRGQFL